MIPVFDMVALNFLVGLGALLLQIFSVILLGAILLRRKSSFAQNIVSFSGSFALPIAFLSALGALVMSLYYSEIYGFAPCGLCWLQRTFVFPMVFLFGLAWWKRDRGIADYGILLSIMALLIGLYQHYLQLGGSDVLPCPAAGPGADCAARILFEFGYITFPLVGVSLALFIIMLMVSSKVRVKDKPIYL